MGLFNRIREWWRRRQPVRPSPQPPPNSPPAGDLPARLLALANAERFPNAVAFTHDVRVQQAAQDHAELMAGSVGLVHSDYGRTLDEAGYSWKTASENIAEGQETAEGAIDAWMRSPGHRENLLGPYHHAGFGAAMRGDGRWFWCGIFATPG